MPQSEQQLENKLIIQLTGLGYERTVIPDATALLANLKTQFEKHNDRPFGNASRHFATDSRGGAVAGEDHGSY